MKIQEEINTTKAGYLPWIDWMKVIAMYFIIAGHCWVPGNNYKYVFSVPCFFIISGFLSHREESGKVFWKKLIYNMVVPMLILLFFGLTFHNLQMYVNHEFQWSHIWKGFLLALAGIQGQNYPAGGLQVLWFVYTLCLCKIILQFTPRNKEMLISLFLIVIGLASACILNSSDVELYNAYADVFSGLSVLLYWIFVETLQVIHQLSVRQGPRPNGCHISGDSVYLWSIQ